uniref:DUF2695 domain-containing protein n=1 Tax=uncultured bacterium Pu8 TaxID=139003 RepID=Q99IY2_9BACT|nr:unknown [uncultured bacterium Pu8]
MASKISKDGHKVIRDALRLMERRDAEARLPASKSYLKELFDWVDAKLEEEGCDHTLKHTASFLRHRSLPDKEVVAWLGEEGGYCDCEVAANAGGRFREMFSGEI